MGRKYIALYVCVLLCVIKSANAIVSALGGPKQCTRKIALQLCPWSSGFFISLFNFFLHSL